MHDKRPEANVAIKGGYSAFRQFRFQSGQPVDRGQLEASSAPSPVMSSVRSSDFVGDPTIAHSHLDAEIGDVLRLHRLDIS